MLLTVQFCADEFCEYLDIFHVFLIVAFVFDDTDMKHNARNDAQQTADEQRIVGRQGADAGHNEHNSTYYNKE